ncbi:MAG: dephospho-CoA kinase [Candidatus Cloacimonetes bacterium]|nr:dephospho-CoA kinase [Candidatus Cloacimonadota bacterium]
MKLHNRPFLVAVTGGIASGKTLVSKWFEKKGFKVYYSDKIGHHFLDDKEVTLKLVKRFGKNILKNNKIDRKKLGSIVFNSQEELHFLNLLLHPKIRRETRRIIEHSNEDYLIFEIPLLFENKIEKAFDLTINVSTDKKNQVERLKKDNRFLLEEIEQRIKSQMQDYDKQKLADINIENNTTLDDLYSKLENLLPIIRKLNYKEVMELI